MTLFLDACVVIYLIESEAAFHARVVRLLATYRRKHQHTRLAVSRLSVLECLVKPMRDGDQPLIDEYRAFFAARDLLMIELAPSVIETALSIRASTGVRTPDALQAASALAIDDDEMHFLTNDRGFERIPALHPVLLGDVL